MGRWANKYVIGLTGNIAMGKSLVRKMLETLGAYTIDADGLAHQAMLPGAPAYGPVLESFGKWIVGPDNKIDRSKLGAVVFSHNDALNKLETLTHPIVGQAIDILISRDKHAVVVVEAIKLVDGVLGSQVDSVWVVDSTPEAQMQRLMTKRGMSEWEARKRIETQNPQADKLAKADVVITNNGSPDDVWAQVQQAWDKTLNRAEHDRPTAKIPPVPPKPPLPDTPTAVIRHPTQPPTPIAPQPARQPQANPQPPPIVPQQVSVTPPPAPLTPPSIPTPTAPVQPSVGQAPGMDQRLQIDVRRGLPKHAEAIARLLSQSSGRPVTRNDVMLQFGDKSFFMAEVAGRLVGLAGFQVENLIARIDEFVLAPDVPPVIVTQKLLSAVETSARELQTEVGFIFVGRNASPAIVQAFIDQGYERVAIDSLRVPAWREAVAEMQNTDKQILMKKLRDTLVLTPV